MISAHNSRTLASTGWALHEAYGMTEWSSQGVRQRQIRQVRSRLQTSSVNVSLVFSLNVLNVWFYLYIHIWYDRCLVLKITALYGEIRERICKCQTAHRGLCPYHRHVNLERRHTIYLEESSVIWSPMFWLQSLPGHCASLALWCVTKSRTA